MHGARETVVWAVDMDAVAGLWQCPKQHYISSRVKNYFCLIFVVITGLRTKENIQFLKFMPEYGL